MVICFSKAMFTSAQRVVDTKYLINAAGTSACDGRKWGAVKSGLQSMNSVSVGRRKRQFLALTAVQKKGNVSSLSGPHSGPEL